MVLHLLQDGIRLKVEFVGYDPNYNLCLVGTPRGPSSVHIIKGFVSVFDCSQFIPPYIYLL